MYLSFYELAEKPFSISADPRFLWRGEKHKEAFANLKYGLLEVNGYVVLTGDVGTGKTTLVNALLETLDDSVLIANINHPTLNVLEFFQIIADAYDPSVEITDKAGFLLFLNSFLKRSHDAGKRALLIIDEAHRLSKELLEEIRLFSNIELAGYKLINIFFVGQNEFKEIIQWSECRALRQRITLFYDIEPLTEDETQQYMTHRLKIAGATDPIFTAKAIRAIHRFTKGYPRLINILCDRALLTGYVQEQRKIDAAIIKECTREMKFLQPVKSNIPRRRAKKKMASGQSLASDVQAGETGSTSKTRRRWLMPTGLAGLLAVVVTAMAINMNFRSSSKDDVPAESGAVGVERHENMPFRPAQVEPSASGDDGDDQPVSAQAASGAADTDPPLLKRQTAKVLLNPPQKQSASAPPDPDNAETAPPPQSSPQPAALELAAEAVEQENFQLGIELLEKHLQNEGDGDSAVSELYARALVGRAEQVGSSSEAATLLHKAVEADPQNVEAQFDLGKLYTQSKNYVEAIDAYQKVVSLNPQFSDAFFNMGFIYATTGRYDDAERQFLRVVQLAPEYQDKALFNLALIQEKLGKRDECLANLHKAVVLKPDNEKAQSYLKRLLGAGEASRQ